MTAVGFEDAWEEFCLIGIQRKGASEVAFAAITEDITAMDWGEKDIEGMKLVNGGNVTKRIPMTDESMTLKIYDVSADLDGTGIVQHFHPQDNDPLQSLSADDTTDPIAVLNSHGRHKHRVILLWSTKLPATASTIPDANEAAYRIQVFNAYITSYKPTFTDKIKSAEITIKWVPFQKDGTRNKIEESTDGSAQLGTATAFT